MCKILITTLMLTMYIMPLYALGVGDQALPLKSKKTYNHSSKKGVTLQSLRGKVVLIDFWATWCGPCIKAMPHLVKLHQEFSNQGLVIVAQTDSSSRKVKNFVKKHNLPFIVSVGENVRKDYGVNSIPHAFLLDTSGTILWRGHTGNVRTSKITKALEAVSMSQKGFSYIIPASTGIKSIVRIENSIKAGKIGNSYKALTLMVEEGKEDEKTKAKSVLSHVQDWIDALEGQIKDQREKGDAYAAYANVSFFLKAMAGSEKEDALRDQKKEIKKSDAYKVGKKYTMLQHKLGRANPAVCKKQYASFAKKYPDTYYGTLAEEKSR